MSSQELLELSVIELSLKIHGREASARAKSAAGAGLRDRGRAPEEAPGALGEPGRIRDSRTAGRMKYGGEQFK